MNRRFAIACIFLIFGQQCSSRHLAFQEVSELARVWSEMLGNHLWEFSELFTRRKAVNTSYLGSDVKAESGQVMHKKVQTILEKMMHSKQRAVENIKTHAEMLSLIRKSNIDPTSSYNYFNTDHINITKIGDTTDLENAIYESEELWKCEHERYRQHLIELTRNKRHSNVFTRYRRQHYPYRRKPFQPQFSDDKKCPDIPYIERRPGFYYSLPLVYEKHFKTEVNANLSAVRLSPNVYYRDREVLRDVRWSEALDLVFKRNYKNDPTLTWQYFASPKGFMRLFPARKWPNGRYEKTLDFRSRPWFTEAMTSPKDVVILLDKSGSMKGTGQARAKYIINNILDTLSDNDYVNIYLFDNSTAPLVECFADTLVQANEENLRLFRESLGAYKPENPGYLRFGIERAFKLLERYRKTEHAGTQCNQVIMIITDGVDNDYGPELFKIHNFVGDYRRHVRVFTYQIGTEPDDEKILEQIACGNLGYYISIAKVAEVPEKVFKYLNVMSRPINLKSEDNVTYVWSTVYANLADRRLTDWLWEKYEGNRQRDIYLDHMKKTTDDEDYGDYPYLEQKDHPYEDYRKPRKYEYMVTVSLPVYNSRPHEPDLLGVAALDIPIDYIKSIIPHYLLGVNGYAFIVSNNGYVVLHPDHRPEFDGILKPTFSRVDMLEVEILDGPQTQRLFDRSIILLRDQILQQRNNSDHFNVQTHIDDMKRVILSRRHYFYGPLGPFSLVVALPERYGSLVVRVQGEDYLYRQISTIHGRKRNWVIHPEWHYCRNYADKTKHKSPEDELLHFLKDLAKSYFEIPERYCDKKLVKALLADYKLTEWFDRHILNSDVIKQINRVFPVIRVFLATHSGLTRWQDLQPVNAPNDKNHFSKKHNKAIDEVWYRRAADINDDEEGFIYAVPFNSSEDGDGVVVTASNAIYVSSSDKRAPAAAVGYQFYQNTLASLVSNITTCKPGHCHSCSGDLSCYVLDNNGFILVNGDGASVGQFFGDPRPDIMNMLVRDGIYSRIKFFDYQAVCFSTPVKVSTGIRNFSLLTNLLKIVQWALATIFYMFESALAFTATKKERENVLIRTKDFERLEIERKVPTPCDEVRYLYSFPNTERTNLYIKNSFENFQNDEWYYVAKKVPKSNLLLVVINNLLPANTTAERFTPTPQPIEYDQSLPCFIATNNNYSRRSYLPCHNRHPKEEKLNSNKKFCGSHGTVNYHDLISWATVNK